MKRFCTECGKELFEGEAFCTNCGTKVAVLEQPEQSAPRMQYTSPQTNYTQSTTTEKTKKSGVVGTAYYFFMMLVYAIPFIGLIACLITAFCGDNQSRKNFAKAVLIWTIIGVILTIIGCVLVGVLGKSFIDYTSTQLSSGMLGGLGSGTEGDLGNFNELMEQLNQLNY